MHVPYFCLTLIIDNNNWLKNWKILSKSKIFQCNMVKLAYQYDQYEFQSNLIQIVFFTCLKNAVKYTSKKHLFHLYFPSNCVHTNLCIVLFRWGMHISTLSKFYVIHIIRCVTWDCHPIKFLFLPRKC